MTDIITELNDGVLRVELNRPDKKNAMTSAMYLRMTEILNEADANDDVRVVLWHGAGGSFTAGNDLQDFIDNPPSAEGSPQQKLTNALIAFGKPLVAAVNGVAVGGGTTMLSHCDFVYAAESTRFQIPFINIALVPEFGSSFMIPAITGHLKAAELFLLGEPFTAAHAEELGLITAVVPDADVLSIAIAMARKLASKPAGALRASKRLLRATFVAQLREAIAGEGQEFSQRARSAEAKEAFTAFLEKRPPNFSKAA